MQPVAPIEVQAPVPSILTTARNRTGDQFGARAAPHVDSAPGSPSPAKYAWRGGLSWTPATCERSHPWLDCPTADQITAKKARAVGFGGPVTVAPFWVYTPVSCDWGMFNREELGGLADRLTDAHTAYGMGRALWMGDGLPDVATQPTLRRSAVDLTPGVVPDLDDAIAILLAEYERATGGNGGAVLHVPGLVMTAMLGAIPGGSVVARRVGDHYEGPLGSLVSPGPGYPYGVSAQGAGGYGPLVSAPATYAGTAEDTVWVYVTGPVEYAVGPPQPIAEPLGAELRRNRTEIWSERQAIVRFDPCATWACEALSPVAFAGVS